MNAVLQRPMFAMPVRRQTGTPEGGEETATNTRVAMTGPENLRNVAKIRRNISKLSFQTSRIS